MTKFFKTRRMIAFLLLGALFLIALSLGGFVYQVRTDIGEDMRTQTRAILENSVRLLRNEVGYLRRITETSAYLMEQMDTQSDLEIPELLRNHAKIGNIVLTLFVTDEGCIYNSKEGYLGSVNANKYIEGVPISDIVSTFFSQPFYSEYLKQVLFGVVTPVTLNGQEGILISAYEVMQFLNLFQNDFMGGQAYVGIVNSKGDVVVGVNTNSQPSAFGENIFEGFQKGSTEFSGGTMEQMQTDFQNGDSGFVIYSINENKRYCAYSGTGINDWVIAVAVQEKTLRNQVTAIQKRGLQLSIEVIVIMAILSVLVVTLRNKEQRKAHRILQKSAMTDGLTGIYNRSAMESVITNIFRGDALSGKHALYVMDIDFFKNINDHFGHMAGDTMLQQFAKQLLTVFDEKDLVGRLGGDEFVVLLTNYPDVSLVQRKAERLLQNFNDKMQVTVDGVTTSISMGIALYEEDGHTFQELYEKADAALYHIKKSGKNGYMLWSAMEKSNSSPQ